MFKTTNLNYLKEVFDNYVASKEMASKLVKTDTSSEDKYIYKFYTDDSEEKTALSEEFKDNAELYTELENAVISKFQTEPENTLKYSVDEKVNPLVNLHRWYSRYSEFLSAARFGGEVIAVIFTKDFQNMVKYFRTTIMMNEDSDDFKAQLNDYFKFLEIKRFSAYLSGLEDFSEIILEQQTYDNTQDRQLFFADNMISESDFQRFIEYVVNVFDFTVISKPDTEADLEYFGRCLDVVSTTLNRMKNFEYPTVIGDVSLPQYLKYIYQGFLEEHLFMGKSDIDLESAVAASNFDSEFYKLLNTFSANLTANYSERVNSLDSVCSDYLILLNNLKELKNIKTIEDVSGFIANPYRKYWYFYNRHRENLKFYINFNKTKNNVFKISTQTVFLDWITHYEEKYGKSLELPLSAEESTSSPDILSTVKYEELFNNSDPEAIHNDMETLSNILIKFTVETEFENLPSPGVLLSVCDRAFNLTDPEATVSFGELELSAPDTACSMEKLHDEEGDNSSSSDSLSKNNAMGQYKDWQNQLNGINKFDE